MSSFVSDDGAISGYGRTLFGYSLADDTVTVSHEIVSLIFLRTLGDTRLVHCGYHIANASYQISFLLLLDG